MWQCLAFVIISDMVDMAFLFLTLQIVIVLLSGSRQKVFTLTTRPSNVKGIAVSVALNSIFISTIESLQRIDLTTDKLVWEKKFEGGCDRMAISPDGKTMYLPSFEKGVLECN